MVHVSREWALHFLSHLEGGSRATASEPGFNPPGAPAEVLPPPLRKRGLVQRRPFSAVALEVSDVFVVATPACDGP